MRTSPLRITVSFVVAASMVMSVRSMSDAPASIHAQPPATEFIPPTRTPTPTPQPPEACGMVIDPPSIEPRILGPGMQATVRFTARYDLGGHSVRRRVAVVVGPIDGPLTATVAAGLVRLTETLDMEGGAELAYVPVGKPQAALVWWSGAKGRASAQAALSDPPTASASAGDWRRAIDDAADALVASPPTVSTALLVVATETTPGDAANEAHWHGLALRLRDALVQRSIVDFSRGLSLLSLTFDDASGAFRTSAPWGDQAAVSAALLKARARIQGLTRASWIHRISLDGDHWMSFELDRPEYFPTATSGAYKGASRMIDARADRIEVKFGVVPTTRLRASTEHVVQLADGSNTLEIRLPGGGSCLAKLGAGTLCVHRPNRAAEECGAFAAALTATAQVASATPTAPSGATATAPSTATRTSVPSALPTASSPPLGTNTSPATATLPARPPDGVVLFLPVAYRER